MNTIENADLDPRGIQPGQNGKTPTMSGITPEQEESDVSSVNADEEDFEDEIEEDFLEDDENIDEMEDEEEKESRE